MLFSQFWDNLANAQSGITVLSTMTADTASKSAPSPNSKIPAPADTGKNANPLSTSSTLADDDSQFGRPPLMRRTLISTAKSDTKPTMLVAVGIPKAVQTTKASSRTPMTIQTVASIPSQKVGDLVR
ncbi:hypothetical protein [Moraxella lacunata]|uniref:hypothetical protein n=1 Tax=Moraxella lacunata TaxID=477 RepID=UPI003EE15747